MPGRAPTRATPRRAGPGWATPRLALAALAVVLVGAFAAALPGPAGLAAQTVERDAGSLRMWGRVVDDANGSALAGVTVVLEPEVLGAFPGAAAGSGFTAAARTTRTDSAGGYRFDGLAAGPYRLYATRYGYRPFAITVELGRSNAAVSVGLEAQPIAIEAVHSRAQGAGPYVAADPFGPETELERVRLMIADLRRRRFLSTDVHELTHADVVEGITLGEPDLFRALQRLPGVTTRSDYTAALWTRGAPWSETRVFFDGIPLFNPLHALGMISGISSTTVGTVWFHPGVRSAGIGEGAAGVVDLRSRPATGTGKLNLQADASLATAGVSLDQRAFDGRAGWMLSGRHSYLDWLADLARRAAGSETPFPYHFSEVAGRVDARLGGGHAVEASWLWEGDRLNGAATPADPLRADWGNALGRVTWSGDLGPYTVQHTAGASRHHGQVRLDPVAEYSDSEDNFRSEEALRRSETGVDYVVLRGALWPESGTRGPTWTVGYELGRYGVRYRGPIPLGVPRADALSVAPSDENLHRGEAGIDGLWTAWRSSLPILALWGERTWRPTDRLTLRGGLRAEAGGEVREASPIRLAPRLVLRYDPLPEVSLSAGLARVFQYAQTVAPGGVQLASLVSTDAWLLAGEGVPALRADIVTAGLEAWLAPDRMASINAFARRGRGEVIPNPEPGSMVARSPFLVIAGNDAVGLEASVRQLAGPVTGSLSYSLTRSRVRARGLEFPSGADRTHVLNATAMVRPLESVRVGAAFTAATGVPFTRSISEADVCETEPGCDPESLPWAGPPNANRGPTHASLDLLVDWALRVGEIRLGVYGQLRNALGRENATVYAGTGCMVVGCSIDDVRNTYEQGVPRLPVLGVRVQY